MKKPHFLKAAVLAGCALVATCGDHNGSITQPPAPAATTIVITVPQLRVDSSGKATAAVFDQHGAAMTGQPITWRSTNTAVVSVDAAGMLRGVSVGAANIEATSGAAHASSAVTVLAHEVTRISVTLAGPLQVGATAAASASVFDEGGASMSGQSVTWRSSNPAVATVSNIGLITAVAAGTSDIQASAGSISGSATLTVLPSQNPNNFAISAAEWTQGVQAADGSIPMILNGGAAVVNVLMTSNATTTVANQVVLRLYDANRQLYRSDTLVVNLSPGGVPSYDSPTLQFYVPASAIKPGMAWQLVRDPRGVLPDGDSHDDVYPASQPVILSTANVPPLKLRFVPIVLTANGFSTGRVTTDMLPEYLRTLRSVHPVGAITTSIAASFSTAASFGTPPSGGDQNFWTQVLRELDLARVLDPTAGDEYWIGVVQPPTGFNFTSYGGFGYVPGSVSATGPGTHTTVLVNVGWFSRPTQSRDLVAHELGHNFGRSHAPCGGAGGPDPNFPFSNGTIGRSGHDVYSLSNGLAQSAFTVSSTTGDVMGYCFPVWSSEYTYRGVLNFRGQTSLSEAARPFTNDVQKVLIISGQAGSEGVTLQPVMMAETRRVLDVQAGDYVVEGLASDSSVLFRQTFQPSRMDHSEARAFTVLVPASDEITRRLETIRVRGAAGASEISNPRESLAPFVASARPSALSVANGQASVGCNGARAVLVQDARTHQLVAVGPRDFVTLPSTATGDLVVWCSAGVSSQRFTLAIER